MRSPRSWKEVCPEQDIKPLKKPLLLKTYKEMLAGKKQSERAKLINSLTQKDFKKYEIWNKELWEWLSPVVTLNLKTLKRALKSTMK